jgi:hypothetical protein
MMINAVIVRKERKQLSPPKSPSTTATDKNKQPQQPLKKKLKKNRN